MPNPVKEPNLFFEEWNTPFGVPDFSKITPDIIRAAYTRALAEEKAAIKAIATNPEPPTFENTIEALERAFLPLQRLESTTAWLAAVNSSPELEAIDRDFTAPGIRHVYEIYQNQDLYKRIKTVHKNKKELSDQQAQCVDIYHGTCESFGAQLRPHLRDEVTALGIREQQLALEFGQRVRAAEQEYLLPLTKRRDFAGLPEWFVKALHAAAETRPNKQVGITLDLSSYETFMAFSARRDLRKKLFMARKQCAGPNSPHDTTPLIYDIMRLRRRMAKIFKAENVADHCLEGSMVASAARAQKFIKALWRPVRKTLLEEKAQLEKVAKKDGHKGNIEPWDWDYYAQLTRRTQMGLNEEKASEYLTLDNTLDAAFGVAQKLFGISFVERHDIPTVHQDVRVWEVVDRDGSSIGLFYGDFLARKGKSGSAWVSEWRVQNGLADKHGEPIVYSCCNFTSGGPDMPVFLNLEDVIVFFHEFGHALQGLLSDVELPSLGGITGLTPDYAEVASQALERWAISMPVLTQYFRHYKTREIMPLNMRKAIARSRKFNSAYRFAEYIGTCAIDMELHASSSGAFRTIDQIEDAAMRKFDIPEYVVPLHRATHFRHAFENDYSARYHAYHVANCSAANIWKRFVDAGDAFDPELGEELRETIFSTGYSQDPKELIKAFCCGEPTLAPLLEYYGLAAEKEGLPIRVAKKAGQRPSLALALRHDS
ncbi:MAG: M3 family metallopeptidase [Bdellovibrionales bacterium]